MLQVPFIPTKCWQSGYEICVARVAHSVQPFIWTFIEGRPVGPLRWNSYGIRTRTFLLLFHLVIQTHLWHGLMSGLRVHTCTFYTDTVRWRTAVARIKYFNGFYIYAILGYSSRACNILCMYLFTWRVWYVAANSPEVTLSFGSMHTVDNVWLYASSYGDPVTLDIPRMQLPSLLFSNHSLFFVEWRMVPRTAYCILQFT